MMHNWYRHLDIEVSFTPLATALCDVWANKEVNFELMCNLKMDPFVLEDPIQKEHRQIGLTPKFFVVPFTLKYRN